MLYSIRHYDGSDLGLKTLYFRREIPLIPSCLGPPAHLSQTAAHENLSALMLHVELFPISVWMCVCVFQLNASFSGTLNTTDYLDSIFTQCFFLCCQVIASFRLLPLIKRIGLKVPICAFNIPWF